MNEKLIGQNKEHPADIQPLRVLVCPDQPSWAFDNIAGNITKFAGANKVSKQYMNDLIGNEEIFFQAIILKRIDLCHVFWREDLFYLLDPDTITKSAKSLGFSYELLVRAINSCAFTTSVYDHLHCEKTELQERRASFSIIDGYTVSSKKLFDIYAAEAEIPDPNLIITDGVDTDRFSPADSPLPRRETFKIGWVGNTEWGKQSQGYDVKGYQRLFLPMLAELRLKGFDIEPWVAAPAVNPIPFDEMPEFYRQMDVMICTSAMEGTPNPVLEAMASGVPIVSTDVGIVPEAFGEAQQPFIIHDEDVAPFADAVASLLENHNKRVLISQENRQISLSWQWEAKSKLWWPFWNDVLTSVQDRRYNNRREHYLQSLA